MTGLLTATMALPDPVPMPAPGWLLWTLLELTFFLHILPMNFVLGGSIIGALASYRGRRPGGEHAAALARWMGKATPVAVAATISFGVPPLLFLQVLYGRLFFSSSVIMGWFWLAVVPTLIVAYYGTYLVAFKGGRGAAWEGPLRWLTVLLFMGTGFMFSNNMSLMLRGPELGAFYAAEPRGLTLNLSDVTLWPRYLHFLLAAVAVAGMWVAGYGLFKARREPAFGIWAMRHGAVWFSGATLVNLLAGFWFLFALPREVGSRFMGQDALATGLLVGGAMLGIGTMVMMFLAVNAPRPEGLVRGGMAGLLLTLICMVLVRDQVRRGALAAIGFEPVPWVVPQWGNIALFLVLMVAALAAVVWMARAYSRAEPGKPA